MRQKFLLLAAVFFGILAFVLTYQQIQTEKRRIRGEAEFVYLIKLNRDVAAGEELGDSDISRVKIKRLRSTRMTYRDIPWQKHSLIIGRRLETSMEKGAVLQWDDLKAASPRKFGLNSIIPPGFRAISIAVDSTSSVTNLIQPGDNVDVIGTFRFPEMRGDKALDTITMTILQEVKVLATGPAWGKQSQVQQANMRRGYSTVTLALSPKEVEMVIFASQKGRLSLSLRNAEETKFVNDLQSVNFKYLEKNIRKYNEERQKRMRSH
jgi:pilus assembly protein CpaB